MWFEGKLDISSVGLVQKGSIMKNSLTILVPCCVETVLLHKSKPVFSWLKFEGYVHTIHTIPDGFCADAKTIPHSWASVDTYVTERSSAAPISKVEIHKSDKCSYYTGHEKLVGIV